MADSSAGRTAGSALGTKLRDLFRLLGSLKLAVVLIAVLAGVLAWATFVEAGKGREYTQWHVYHSRWFAALLGLLAVNIFASAASRFPWGRKRIGFLITHGGLLVLLAGSIQTFVAGIDGQLGFEEGQTANSVRITDRCQFTASWQAQGSGSRPRSVAFIFHPGPVDWPDGKTLDVGELGGVAIEVLKFYRHARVEEDWVEDRVGRGSPALKFVLAGPDGRPVREEWLVADQLGSQVFVGPVKFEFQRVLMDSMLEDFLKPPAADTDKDGVLSMHYEGRMQRIPVSKSIGKKIPLGDGKVQVEIAEHLPDAKPLSGGRYTSRSEKPNNPLLELRVHVGKEHPLRQIAFARFPFLNHDGIHGASCPVKFWYHHPAVTSESGVEFLQTPDRKVYCRVGMDGKYQSRGAVTKDQPIEFAAQFTVSISELLPHARREVSFLPLELGPGEERDVEPAALIRVSAGGTTEEVWMQRNHSEYGMQRIQTKEGPLDLRFGNEHLPLGFSLRLVRFTRGMNPGRMGAASFASRVRLIDPHHGINEERNISMNEPLSHGRYTFYQSSYKDLDNGKSASILSVAYDPGRLAKYLGSLMICLGIFVMFYSRLAGSEKAATWLTRRQGTEDSGASAGQDSGPSSAASNGKKTQKQVGADLAEIG